MAGWYKSSAIPVLFCPAHRRVGGGGRAIWYIVWPSHFEKGAVKASGEARSCSRFGRLFPCRYAAAAQWGAGVWGPGAVAWFSRRCCGYNCWATKGQFAPRVGTQIACRVVTDRDLLEGACAREVHHQYVLVLSRRKPFPRICFNPSFLLAVSPPANACFLAASPPHFHRTNALSSDVRAHSPSTKAVGIDWELRK